MAFMIWINDCRIVIMILTYKKHLATDLHGFTQTFQRLTKKHGVTFLVRPFIFLDVRFIRVHPWPTAVFRFIIELANVMRSG